MGSEMMDMEQLAAYLQRDVREVGKLASRGHLPGHKVAGEWRFARPEVNQWIESQIHSYTDQQLTALERGEQGPLLATLLAEASVAVPLRGSSRSSVLKELVGLAEQSWHLYDADALFDAIRQREDVASTALENGVAIPHPRRPTPTILGESVIAYGRTASPIPFGEPNGALSDIFFLVACRDDRTHLSVLARLTRLFQRPGFLDELRTAETAAESYERILAAEQELLQT